MVIIIVYIAVFAAIFIALLIIALKMTSNKKKHNIDRHIESQKDTIISQGKEDTEDKI